jgi:hypothetical protein
MEEITDDYLKHNVKAVRQTGPFWVYILFIIDWGLGVRVGAVDGRGEGGKELG